MSLNCSDYVGKRVAWHEVDDCTGLVVGYADFSEMPACLRSVDSPDFDLLILQDLVKAILNMFQVLMNLK